MVMAGGKGQRLFPLTKDRAKPAVPFAGKYRIIDFVLSNLVNSGVYSIYVLTQFKSQSLSEHLLGGWSFGNFLKDHWVLPVPAQQQSGETWYQGTADAIYQNLNLIRQARPHLVCIFGGDHIYRMDVSQMVEFHESRMADCTVAAITVPIEDATAFGVIEVDDEWRIMGFEEKPSQPKPIPGQPDKALVSMGNYVFSGRTLVSMLEEDAEDPASSHDFGKDIIPKNLSSHRLFCYDFTQNRIPGRQGLNTYWRDVGTIESFYEANMDLRAVVPQFNLYNDQWPIRTHRHDDPPAKFVHDASDRRGQAIDSIVGGGTIISGGMVKNSIIGRNVKVHSFAEVTDSIIFDRVHIGRGCRIHKAIVDKNNHLDEGLTVGFDAEADRTSYHVSPTGIVVIPKRPRMEAPIGTLRL